MVCFRYQVGGHVGHANRSGNNDVSVCGTVPLLPQIHAVLPVLDGVRYSQSLVSSTQVSIDWTPPGLTRAHCDQTRKADRPLFIMVESRRSPGLRCEFKSLIIQKLKKL